MKVRSLLLILLAAASFAKGSQPVGNLPITSTFETVDASGTMTEIQSDGQGSYLSSVAGVTSFLTTNGYNHIIWGDWQFDALNSTTRLVGLSFANPIQVADGGSAIPNPPFTIKNVRAHIEDKCTQIFNDMITMSVNQTFQCPLIVHFFDSNGAEYRIYMGPNWELGTTYAQVACNAVASDGCKDWFIDPIPAGHDPAGNLIPGEAIGRLRYFTKHSSPNEGDYYFRFHFHLTRP
jgi:hypothetical protein